MARNFTLSATARNDVGKGASRRLRRASQVPAIVYGTDREPQAITLMHNAVINALKEEAFYSHILSLTIDGKEEKVVLRDLQRHHFKPQILHIDFQRISETEKLTMLVPLHFIGGDVAPGVKMDGGIVAHLITEVDIRCLPKDLPEFITVDISQLRLNQTLHFSDLQLQSGVELVDLVHGENKSVVTVYIPRAIVETATAVSAAAVPSETGAAEGEAGKAKSGDADKAKGGDKGKGGDKSKK